MIEIAIRHGLAHPRCERINPREGMIVNEFRNALIAPRFADAFTASRTTAAQFREIHQLNTHMVFILAILIAQLETELAQQATHFEGGLAKADSRLFRSIAVRAMHGFPWRRGRRWRPHEQPRIFNGARQSRISTIALSALTKPLGPLRKTLRRRRNPFVIEGGKFLQNEGSSPMLDVCVIGESSEFPQNASASASRS